MPSKTNRIGDPRIRFLLYLVFVTNSMLVIPGEARAATTTLGEETYKFVCIGCHMMGILNAPKHQDVAEWRKRFAKGEETLVRNALNGIGKMPPKGGNPNVTEEGIRAAIRYMAGAAVDEPTKTDTPKKGIVPIPTVGHSTNGNAVSKPQPKSTSAKAVVDRVCKGCHEVGILGAPKIGVVEDWESRLKKGEEALVDSAEKGLGSMPPKGGDSSLSRDDLLAAIRHMVKQPVAGAQQEVVRKPSSNQSAKSANEKIPKKQAAVSTVNRFNRLMTPPSKRNPPPAKDGIHDPDNPGTLALQPPKEAFDLMAKGKSGNYVDWVRAFVQGEIEPRYDRDDPTKKPIVMDLNIVREVKGSMPDVVYPHKPHLEWLDCSNCHPAIFEPKKGANSISMAEILLGKKCGVCHGKVAFPVSECRRCHSKKKSLKAASNQ